jgi:hypothetical protein
MAKRSPSLWTRFFRWFGDAQVDSDAQFATAPPDGIPWEVASLPRRVIAIGDVHGDLVALGSILTERSLIDEDGRWIGADAHLVLVGDLVSGDGDSRLVISFVLRLEAEARRAGGAVHALLGNHDVALLAKKNEPRRRERKLFEVFPVVGAESTSVRDAFRGHTPPAQWLRRRNAILKIGDTVFAHAGLDDWALEQDPDRINATVRTWLKFWQGVGEKPPAETRWAVGKLAMRRGSRHETGPLWTRVFKLRDESDDRRPAGAPKRKKLAAILEKYRGSRLVIGHAPVRHGEIVLDHPYYGEQLVMLDTRISDRKRGRLSCLEQTERGLRAHYTKRTDAGRRVREKEWEALEAQGRAPLSFGSWLRRWLGKLFR